MHGSHRWHRYKEPFRYSQCHCFCYQKLNPLTRCPANRDGRERMVIRVTIGETIGHAYPKLTQRFDTSQIATICECDACDVERAEGRQRYGYEKAQYEGSQEQQGGWDAESAGHDGQVVREKCPFDNSKCS
jgi:hypothetical protein